MRSADYQLAHAVLYVIGVIVVLVLVDVVAVTYRAGAPGLRAFAAVLLRLAAVVAAVVAILTVSRPWSVHLPASRQTSPPAVVQDLEDGESRVSAKLPGAHAGLGAAHDEVFGGL